MSENIQSNSMSDTPKFSPDIQIILSKSYSLFFFSFVLGLIIDVLIRLRINIPNIEIVGFCLLVLSSMLVYWAQSVNKTAKYNKDGTRNFSYGPYSFSRHPTYLGIFLMMFGAGLVMNSVSIAVVSIISFVVANFTFMAKEEARHIKKYGDLYINYTKKVRKII
jgi:protein-S-isoprenylcysteine O-methyltransferase Ste14